MAGSNKVFLDFGTNKFQGVEAIYKREKMNETWDVYTFEPNKLLRDWGVNVKPTVEKRINNTITQYPYGIWNENTTKTFSSPAHTDNETGGGHVTEIGEQYRQNSVPIRHCDYRQEIELRDVKEIIERHKGSEIVIKMDIEGSEYTVIDRILECDLGQYIKTFYIEYHARLFVNQAEMQKKQEQQIQDLRQTSNVHLWH